MVPLQHALRVRVFYRLLRWTLSIVLLSGPAHVNTGAPSSVTNRGNTSEASRSSYPPQAATLVATGSSTPTTAPGTSVLHTSPRKKRRLEQLTAALSSMPEPTSVEPVQPPEPRPSMPTLQHSTRVSTHAYVIETRSKAVSPTVIRNRNAAAYGKSPSDHINMCLPLRPAAYPIVKNPQRPRDIHAQFLPLVHPALYKSLHARYPNP